MRTRRHKLQVSTFPFLAVLLCAMGALLLVLLVMDRRAHYAARARARAEQAIRRAAEETASAADARRIAVEDRRLQALAARQQEHEAAHARLSGQEAELQKEIQSVREELARAAARLQAEQDGEAALKQKIEAEHSRAGEEEQALIRVKAEEATASAKSESSRKELEEMTAGLARLEKNLANLKAAREKEEKTYSLVPYNGKRGENRKPVYVECAAGQVVFHPDRTPLEEPLSAPAVQAEVERRVARQKERLPAAQAAAFTPYLMLLVRPDGVSTYYRFRETLQGMKIDFGYEFVDRDWVLDFPADDQDAPPPAWTTAAKPAAVDPAPPAPAGGASARLHGVPPAFGSGLEGVSGAPHPGDGPPGLPGMAPAPPGFSVASTAGPVGPALTGPVGNGSGGPTVGLNGAPLSASPDAGAGPVLTGPDVTPRPAAPGGGPWKGGEAGAGGSPGPAAPRDPRVIATGSPTAPPVTLQPPSPGSGPSHSPGVSGQGAANTASATAAAEVAKSGYASSWATQGGQTAPGSQAAPGSTGAVAPKDKSSAPPVPGPNQATPPTTAATGAAKNSPTPPRGGSRGSGGDNTAAADNPDDEPFLRSPPTPVLPSKKHQPAPLRPARLSGDRDWILYIECKPEGVVIYPTQLLVPVAALNRPSGSNPLLQTIQQMINRKQAAVRPGEMPYRPEVRFLVRPEAERTYHLAYPTLDALATPKTSQNLGPDDDVSAVVAGH